MRGVIFTIVSLIIQDEFGMSMLHSAASRTHNRNAFFQLLQELDANIGLRNEHYKTPRDIAVSSNIRENVKTIDKYVVHIIARGDLAETINLSSFVINKITFNY